MKMTRVIYRDIGNEVSVWFNLRYNCSKIPRSTSLSYLCYFLMIDKETSFFYACVSNLANEVGRCKKTYARKSRRDSSWTNASRILLSVFKDRGWFSRKDIQKSFVIFPHLLSRFALLNLITRDGDSGGSNSFVTTCYPEEQLCSRAKLRSFRGFYCVALL